MHEYDCDVEKKKKKWKKRNRACCSCSLSDPQLKFFNLINFIHNFFFSERKGSEVINLKII